MTTTPIITFDDLAARYGERQVQTKEGLLQVLEDQIERFDPDGWMLLECQMLGGSKMGELTIMPFGPNNTFKSPPSHPISPRGLASDMAVVVALVRPWSVIEATKMSARQQAEAVKEK